MILKPIVNKTLLDQREDVEEMRYLMMRYVNETILVNSKNIIWNIRGNLIEPNRTKSRNI